MLRKFEFSVTFWRPDGSRGDKQCLKQLAEQHFTTLGLRGMDDPHSDVWITAGDISLDRYRGQDEPHEAMFGAIAASLTEFARMLDQISTDNLGAVRQKGYSVTGIVNAEVDDNQIEVILPAGLLVSLGRLGIDLRINSDACM